MPTAANPRWWVLRQAAVSAFAVMSCLVLAGCTQSARSEDVVLPGETPAGKNDPYPDFSKPLSSAMPQMTDEEAKKMDRQMSALAARRQSGAISEAEYWRRVNEMRKLQASMPREDAQ